MTQDHLSLQSAIDRIIHLFKKTYQGSDGLPVYDVNGETGEPLSRRNLICEFDDYAPFFWILNEVSLVTEHHQKLTEMLDRKPLLFDRPQIRAEKGLGLPGSFRRMKYADSQDYIEILYGLIELYTLSHDHAFLKTARCVFERIERFFLRNNSIRSFRMMPFGPTVPVSDAMSGMFIEIACDLSALTDDRTKKQRYLGYAEEWMDGWTKTEMFQNHGVFPSVDIDQPWRFLPGARQKMSFAELAKPNASMAYGILALAGPPHHVSTARTVFEKWIDGIMNCFRTPEGVLSHIVRFNGSAIKGPVLSTNFAILDLLCDAVFLFDCNVCRRLARTITEYFLTHRSGTTGLVPDEPGKDRSYIDANSDFAVSLAKMTEITGDASYRETGRELVGSILAYHSAPYGFYRDVHLHTGKPLSHTVETRFCSLLLKPLILYRDNIRVYGETGHWSLFRDR
jgi:hypothetical protein